MNNVIGISTGNIYTWSESVNKQIDILRQTKVDAIEVLFGRTDELNQEISPENIDYLKQLKYVSIHAPFYDAQSDDLCYNADSAGIVNRIKEFYSLFNAKAVVFHINLIKDFGILENTGMNVCFENMPKKRNASRDSLKQVYEKHPECRLVLDTAHALTFDKARLNEIIQDYRSKIQHVHLSDRRFSEYRQKVRDHEQMASCKDLEKFSKVKELACPVIIEASFKQEVNDLSAVRREIEFVKDFFSYSSTKER